VGATKRECRLAVENLQVLSDSTKQEGWETRKAVPPCRPHSTYVLVPRTHLEYNLCVANSFQGNH